MIEHRTVEEQIAGLSVEQMLARGKRRCARFPSSP